MSIQGLAELKLRLSEISKTAVPRATSQAINRIAGRAISKSVSVVTKDTKIPRKLVRGRARLRKATSRKPQAIIRVNRGNLPAIKLGPASVRLSRRKRDKRGVRSVLHVGRFRFPGAFIQQLDNGRWHVMQRESKSRYPIDVVKIPLTTPLTTAFKNAVPALMQSDMPKEMQYALRNQIRLIVKR
ncbi:MULTISPECIES: phage tail protein [Klebsiella]|uniref:phage tail protein n=1 Tax=Klebsiella TaxID=570 RepID=UPI0012B6B253|nr:MULTISPECIES: phage tail protein [Klebsiella]MBA7848839.1 phage tail protein [Klebsiella sp. RHBSTW-00465]